MAGAGGLRSLQEVGGVWCKVLEGTGQRTEQQTAGRAQARPWGAHRMPACPSAASRRCGVGFIQSLVQPGQELGGGGRGVWDVGESGEILS